MKQFEYFLYYLIFFGLPTAGFLLGCIWGYLKSVQNEDCLVIMAVTTLSAGVLIGFPSFYIAILLARVCEVAIFQQP